MILAKCLVAILPCSVDGRYAGTEPILKTLKAKLDRSLDEIAMTSRRGAQCQQPDDC